MLVPPRYLGGALIAVLAIACAQSSGSASADTAAARAPVAAVRTVPATTLPTDTTHPSVVSVGSRSTQTGAPRGSGCGGTFVNVTVKATALGSSGDAADVTRALRALAGDLLAPLRGQVGTASFSPAIRAFRVAITDVPAANQVMARLRAAPQVENVELDQCVKAVER